MATCGRVPFKDSSSLVLPLMEWSFGLVPPLLCWAIKQRWMSDRVTGRVVEMGSQEGEKVGENGEVGEEGEAVYSFIL